MIGYPPFINHLIRCMFGFNKRKKPDQDSTSPESDAPAEQDLAEKLSKTRRGFADGMADFLLGKKDLDENMLDELETTLLSADVGIEATSELLPTLRGALARHGVHHRPPHILHAFLASPLGLTGDGTGMASQALI